MPIDFDETLIAHFFVALPGHDDWMAGLNRMEDGCFRLAYRFREADPVEPGADPWENIDRKCWMEGTFKAASAAEAIARVHIVAQELALAGGSQAHMLVREHGETLEHFFERFSRQPYVHVKKATPGTPEWDQLMQEHPELADAVAHRMKP